MATITEIQQIIQDEYDRLCLSLDLKPMQLNIYGLKKGVTEREGYSGISKIIKLPQEYYDLINYPNQMNFNFPPKHWTKLKMDDEWPKWRCGLWHEVCHQIQDQKLGKWKPPTKDDDGHKIGWKDAADYFANRFNSEQMNVDRNTIFGIIW